MNNVLNRSDIQVRKCPCCGSVKILLHEYAPESWVECLQCGAHTKVFSFWSNAIEEWNIGNVEEVKE